MQYRTVPKNGDKLSVLCMRLPLKGENIDEERAIKQIRYSIDKAIRSLTSEEGKATYRFVD